MISVSIDHDWDGVCSKYSWTTAAADKQTYRMVYRDRSALPLVARFTMFANPARNERISVLLQIWSEQRMATGCQLKSVGACGTYDSAPARLLRPRAIHGACCPPWLPVRTHIKSHAFNAPTSNPTLPCPPIRSLTYQCHAAGSRRPACSHIRPGPDRRPPCRARSGCRALHSDGPGTLTSVRD